MYERDGLEGQGCIGAGEGGLSGGKFVNALRKESDQQQDAESHQSSVSQTPTAIDQSLCDESEEG